jgi:peptidoglycan/LPS O-acetylase OafA/YrhL
MGRDGTKYHFEFAVWPMMFGFCCEYQKERIAQLTHRWAPALIRLSLGMLATSLILMLFGSSAKKLVIASGTFVFAPCFLSYVSGKSMPPRIGRPLQYVGERTYSIYLWQQPFTICNYLPYWWHPVGSLVSIFAGAVWFYLFEQPFLSSVRRQSVAKPASG